MIWILGSKENRDKLAYKPTKIIRIEFFFRNHLFCLIYANNKLKLQQNIVICFKPFTEIKFEGKYWNFDFRSDPHPLSRWRIRIKMKRIRNATNFERYCNNCSSYVPVKPLISFLPSIPISLSFPPPV